MSPREVSIKATVRLLVELRDVADYFKERGQFEERFRTWVQPLLRRPSLVQRLRDKKFVW